MPLKKEKEGLQSQPLTLSMRRRIVTTLTWIALDTRIMSKT